MTNKRSETKLPGLLLGVMDGGALERRVMRLLGARLPWARRWRVLSAAGCAVAMAAVCLGGAMVSVRAQERTIKFDVVSIKPSAPGATVYDGGGSGMTEDGFHSRILPLSSVVSMAYFPLMNRAGRVTNMPPWMTKENYDVVAKVSAEDAEAWQKASQIKSVTWQDNTMLQQALRTMLAERMKLAVHTEPLEVDGLALVVSKRGAKMAEASPNDKAPEVGIKLPDGGLAVGVVGPNRRFTQMTFYNMTMEALQAFLQGSIMKQLKDETGLKGRYHFVLYPRDFAPDEVRDPDHTDTWDLGPLGLEIRPAKVKTMNVVIDHIERPSEN